MSRVEPKNKKSCPEQSQKVKLIVILGPTASGKSDLAVEIAKEFNGEIISADSRQVYKGMDIGTGKVPLQKCPPTIFFDYKKMLSPKKVMSRENETVKCYKNIPHYLLDVASPKRRFAVAQYKRLALNAIKNIQRRGKLPIICGGSGFYIQTMVDNITIPKVKPDWKLRAKLEKKSEEELFKELKKRDPERARNIDRHNKRRLIRALEIIYKTGKPVPPLVQNNSLSIPPSIRERTSPSLGKEWRQKNFDALYLGIKKSPSKLKKLIHKRLVKRLRQGMVKEVESLHQSGLSWKRLEEFGLEYRWIAKYLQKKISRQEMVVRLQKDIEHFAKRQMTWFKRDKRIKWIQNKNQAQKLIVQFLK